MLSDYLLQESLQFRQTAPVEGKDSFARLACRFADLKFCSVAMDPEKSRISRLCEEAIENQAGGLSVSRPSAIRRNTITR